MKQREILKNIKELIDYEYSNCFILVEQADMIYISYDPTLCNLYDAYIKCKQFAESFETEIILNFGDYDILIDTSTTMDDVKKQYTKESRFAFEIDIQNEFELAVKELNFEKISKLIKKENWKSDYISNYQLRNLSQTLYDKYKITQSDPYLDNMVDNVKTLIKK